MKKEEILHPKPRFAAAKIFDMEKSKSKTYPPTLLSYKPFTTSSASQL